MFWWCSFLQVWGSFELWSHCSFYLVTCLLTISMSALEKCIFGCSPIFLMGLLIFMELYDMFVYFGNELSVALLADIFSHSIGCLFILFMASFAIWKLLIKSHLFIYITLGDSSKNILLPFMFCLCFSLGILYYPVVLLDTINIWNVNPFLFLFLCTVLGNVLILFFYM